ncbi:ATP-binding protein [Pararhodobacter sp. CCB-MM2]|uniref:ATP-binding protein n=1 Tax=Pararhodobacter sp. CCB-MM2 TaxID=1786003 RepID=UPI000AD1460B|nr:ATP-binding protein [Pararhodobacter sp. CCB-MM2]
MARNNSQAGKGLSEGRVLGGRRIGMVRVTAWSVMAMGIGWVGLAYLTGHPSVAISALVAVIASILCILLIDLGYSLLGRVVWFLGGTSSVFMGGFLIHPLGNIGFMYAAMVAAPFLVFSRRTEGPWLYAMVALNVLAWFTQWVLGADYFGPPAVGAEEALRYYALPAGATSFVVLILEIAYFDATFQAYGRRLTQASEDVLSATRAKGDLLAAMSHEIRTPMNGVVGMIELLETSPLSQEQKRMLATVRESSFALLRIIDDILDVSKAEAGKLQINPEPLDLLALVEGISDTLVPLARKRGIWLNQVFDPALPRRVSLDGDRVRQILVNLLGNAIKFSERPSGDRRESLVTLRVEVDDGMIAFTVTDNGIGMDEETLAHAFERYIQSNAVNTRRFGGTGLGLAIVHQLVKHMSGSIAVNSQLGEGTTISVKLPLVQPQGRLLPPALAGRPVVMLFTSAFKQQIASTYVEPTGATLFQARDEENLHRLAQEHGANAVYIIAPETAPRVVDDALVDRFETAFPTAPFITFSAQPSDRFGAISATMMRVQWSPVKLSEFWEAIAVSARQQRPAPEVSSAEAAVAANAEVAEMPRVLVVEDNEINREVMSRQLRALGYGVVLASDGEEGLQKWRSQDVAMVLTDCHMPRMDGFEMTARIREIEAAEGLPRSAIVAITANALNDETQRCTEAGMDSVLSKPVRLAQLRDAVAQWVAVGAKARGGVPTPADGSRRLA